MKLIEASPISSKVAKDSLTYFSAKKVSVGDIVSVEVRKKRYDALVVGVSDVSASKGEIKSASFGVKKVEEVLGSAPFYPEFFETCRKTRDYFVGNLGQIIDFFIPSEFLENYEGLMKPKKRISDNAGEISAFQKPFIERINKYKKLAQKNLSEGRSVFIVLPTVVEVQKFSELLELDPDTAFVFHSKTKKPMEKYNACLASSKPVVLISTPSFLFIPRHDLGLIIFEHEASANYRTIKRPYFDLRAFVKFHAKNMKTDLLFGGEILSLESVHEFGKELDYALIAPCESTQVVDMSEKENLFKGSPVISQAAANILKKNGHTFLFALRKGFASQVVCHDCKHVLSHEGMPLSLHEQGGKMVFRNTYTRKPLDTKVRCPNCGSWNFDSLGMGTDKVREEIKKLFPKREIFQVDKDATGSATKAREAVKEFLDSTDGILIGTEMVLPHLTEVTNSVIISMDSLLHIPSYKIYEKMVQLGSAICNITQENFLIQTRDIENAVVQALQKNDLKDFYEKDIEKRRLFGYPPFSTVIKLARISNREDNTILESLGDWQPTIRRIKRGNAVETSILLKVSRDVWDEGHQDPELSSILSSLGPDWQIRINPENLF